MCWGGKVVALSVKASTNPFSVAASVHPAMVDPADADGITIPMTLLASKEEPADTVKKFEDALKVPKHVEIRDDLPKTMIGKLDRKALRAEIAEASG